ncbi:molecular chaperone DnaK [Nematocida sp. AWRm80]|nr:molecular chaperone DnaK [Nematocida sp. AWRm80]
MKVPRLFRVCAIALVVCALCVKWVSARERMGDTQVLERLIDEPHGKEVIDTDKILEEERKILEKELKEEHVSEADTKVETEKKDEVEKQPVVLGIDLGTTYSVVSIYTPSKASVETVSYESGKNTMPSFIKMEVVEQQPPKNILNDMIKAEQKYKSSEYFYYKGIWVKKGFRQLIKPIVGWKAMEMTKDESHSVDSYLYRFKPLLARSFTKTDDAQVIRDTIKEVKYSLADRVDPSTGNHVVGILIKHNGKEVGWTTPMNLSAMVLSTLKDRVNTFLNDYSKKKCAVTVPAYFNDDQKKETRLAAAYANLEVLDEGILNEPTSAAVAYAYTCEKTKGLEGLGKREFLVFDFGGGTVDISYLNYAGKSLVAGAHAGDNFLGGENVNDVIYNHFIAEMVRQKVIPSPKALDINTTLRLRHTVEDMKIKLCEEQNVIDDEIREKAKKEGTQPDYSGPENNAEQRRSFFVSEKVGEVELVLTTNTLNSLCQGIYNKLTKIISNDASKNTEESNGVLNKINKTHKEIKNVLYVGGSSRISGVRRLLMKLFPEAKHCFDLDADTCVSIGAAYHAATHENLIDEKDYIALIDALPMNMGIRLDQDMFDVMAKAGAQVPNTFTKIFATTTDAQKSVQIEIGQTSTETKKFSNTKIVGRFRLDMPHNNLSRGKKLIEVTFDFGNGGDIEVVAKELGETENKNENKIIIKKEEAQMSSADIAKMNEEYEKTRYEEEIWLNKCEAVKKLEEFLHEIDAQAKQLPDTTPKKKDIQTLYKENQYWFDKEVKNREDIPHEEMIEKVNEKMAEIKTALEALTATTSAPEETQPQPQPEEFIPKEDL